jgi:hypothetical protein
MQGCAQFGLGSAGARQRKAVSSDAAPVTAGAHCDLCSPPTEATMIRKLASGQYRLYSRQPDPKTGKRRNLGTFESREQAQQHEREVQYFKHRG